MPIRPVRRSSTTSRALVAVGVVALLSLTPLSAQAADPVPLAARLIAEDYATGVRVTVTNMANEYGLATDATRVYLVNGSGNIVTTLVADIPMTAGGDVTVVGTVHTVGWGIAGAPALPSPLAQLSISYSHGCLFMTNGDNTAGNVRLYCIDITDWSVTEISIPAGYPMPIGYNYTISSLIDFPDGRIGKVSRYEPVTGGYQSVLRTYSLTGTGKAVTLAFSEDFTMFDTDNWAVDEHGVATDGTYLYRIQYRTFNPNFKSWKLVSGASAPVLFSGNFTEPFANMHFLAHDHTQNYYLVGFHNDARFFITQRADPGPGPGSIPVAAAAAAGQSGLAATGLDVTLWPAGGVLMVVAGLALVVLRRRSKLV